MKDFYTSIPKNEDEYLTTRVADQIKWFDENSIKNKKKYIRLKTVEIFLSLSVPIFTSQITETTSVLKIITMIIAALVSLIGGITTLVRYHDNWIESRTVAESLKYEKYLFTTRSGSYKNDKAALNSFVERFEGIIINSTKKWTEDSSKKNNSGNGTDVNGNS